MLGPGPLSVRGMQKALLRVESSAGALGPVVDAKKAPMNDRFGLFRSLTVGDECWSSPTHMID